MRHCCLSLVAEKNIGATASKKVAVLLSSTAVPSSEYRSQLIFPNPGTGTYQNNHYFLYVLTKYSCLDPEHEQMPSSLKIKWFVA